MKISTIFSLLLLALPCAIQPTPDQDTVYDLIYSTYTASAILRPKTITQEQQAVDKLYLYEHSLDWYNKNHEQDDIFLARDPIKNVFTYVSQHKITPLKPHEIKALLASLESEETIRTFCNPSAQAELEWYRKTLYKTALQYLIQPHRSEYAFEIGLIPAQKLGRELWSILQLRRCTEQNDAHDKKTALLEKFFLETLIDQLIILTQEACGRTVAHDLDSSIVHNPSFNELFKEKTAALAHAFNQFSELFKKGTSYAKITSDGMGSAIIASIKTWLYLALHGQPMHNAYTRAGMMQALECTLVPFTHTHYGRETLIRHCLPLYSHDQAQSVIEKRMLLVELLNSSQYQEIRGRIDKLIEEFAHIKAQKKSINMAEIEQHLAKFIPPSFIGGMNAGKSSFALYSLLVQWHSTLMAAAKNSFKAFGSQERAQSSVLVQNPGPLWGFLFPPLWRLTLKNSDLWKHFFPQTWGDFLDLGRTLFGGQPITKETISPLPIAKEATSCFFGSTYFAADIALETYSWYSTIRGTYDQAKATYNVHQYLALCKQEMQCVRQLYLAVIDLYKAADKGLSDMPREIACARDILFSNSPDQQGKNLLPGAHDTSLSKIKNAVLGMLAPGVLSHFYFKTIKNNDALEFVYRFVGEIDAACAKTEALKHYSKGAQKLCIPQIAWNCKKPFLHSINTWYPAIPDSVTNSFMLEKNMLINGPVESGKTVAMTSLLLSIYALPLGIGFAEEIKSCWFDLVVDNITTQSGDFAIGGGVSGHRGEQRRMKELQECIAEQEGFSFVCIDEIYTRTSYEDAICEALKELPKVLKNDKTITSVSTHHAPLVPLACDELRTDLYYLEIQEPTLGIFVRTFKIKCDVTKDSPDNWWHKDTQKCKRYKEQFDQQ